MPKAYIIHQRWISYRRYIIRSVQERISLFFVYDKNKKPRRAVYTRIQKPCMCRLVSSPMFCAPSVPVSRDVSRGGGEVCIPFIGSLSGLHFSSVGLIARISQTKQGAGRTRRHTVSGMTYSFVLLPQRQIKVDFRPLKDENHPFLFIFLFSLFTE